MVFQSCCTTNQSCMYDIVLRRLRRHRISLKTQSHKRSFKIWCEKRTWRLSLQYLILQRYRFRQQHRFTSCLCYCWRNTFLLCKNMPSVLNHIESVTWDSFGTLYRHPVFFTLDFEVLGMTPKVCFNKNCIQFASRIMFSRVPHKFELWVSRRLRILLVILLLWGIVLSLTSNILFFLFIWSNLS